MSKVVVVGAGVIGLFCALRLARAGVRVTLLEAEPDDLDVFRPTASTSAAGMLAPFDNASSAHLALALESLNLWRTLSPGSAWADGVRFDGGVIVCATPQDAAAVQARAMQAGRSAAPLSPAQFAKRAGVKAAFENALFVEDEGVADPLRVMSGLAEEARRHGVLIHYNQDAAKVSPHAVITHTGEEHEADHVVLAPGAWATAALIAAAPALAHIRPAKGHLLPVRTPAPLLANLHAPGFYLARRREDAVLGATLQLDHYERHVEAAQVEALLARAQAAMPGLVELAGRPWTGIRPMSPDGWPMIGKSGDVLVAAGHSRHGWLLAPVTAELIAAHVLGAEIGAAWAALAPQRFGP